MIYADHNATTPPLPEVVQAMRAALEESWGNPGSRQHAAGRRALALLDGARHAVAGLLGARDEEIVFTSGATEALNLAILGLGERLLATRPRLVSCASEHPAVLEALARLREAGAEVLLLPVDGEGRLDPQRLADAIDDRTGLVCLMAANHETGVIHDVAQAAHLAHARGALLLCDATQAVGRMPLDVAGLGADAVACSAHKLYGPQGSGALWLRRGLGLSAQLHGGSQERGLRPGTPNLPGIAGFAAACAAARRDLAPRIAHLSALGARLEDRVRALLPGVVVQGGGAPRAPGTSMFTLPGLCAGWLATLSGVAASGGAACTAGQVSRTLLAMGCAPADAGNSIRISLGLGSSLDDAEAVAGELARGAAALHR